MVRRCERGDVRGHTALGLQVRCTDVLLVELIYLVIRSHRYVDVPVVCQKRAMLLRRLVTIAACDGCGLGENRSPFGGRRPSS